MALLWDIVNDRWKDVASLIQRVCYWVVDWTSMTYGNSTFPPMAAPSVPPTGTGRRGPLAGGVWWLRPLLTLLGLAGLVVALRDFGRHTDSVSVFANALALGWLAAVVTALVTKRRLGFTRAILLACLAVGVLRAVVSLWGIPVGWILFESIEVGDRFASSQLHVRELGFPAGAVPAHLINNNRRFNFYASREGDPDRTKLPVSVTAKAFVAGQGVLRISSSSPIRITTGSEVTELRPPIVNYERELSLAGEELFEIAMEPTGVDKAALEVQSIGIQPYAYPTAGALMTVRRALGRTSGMLDILVIAASVWVMALGLCNRLARMRRERLLAFGLVTLVLFLELGPHLLAWFSQHDMLPVLSGGDDWLTYETFARDIRDNSPLMLLGKPLGGADPFYYQALYPYLVAIGHLVVGESVQGVVLLQLLGAGLVLCLAFLAVPEGTLPTAILLAVAMGTGILGEWVMLAERLLSENALIIVFALLLYLMSRLKAIPSVADMALIGTLLGIAVLVRSTSWTAVPLVPLLLLRGMPRKALLTAVAFLIIPVVLLAALVPARNLIAAGTPAPLPSSGSINLYMGNVPTGRKLTTEPWIGLSRQYDPRLVAVAEAIVDAPDQVAKKIADKAVYVLGFPRSLDADNPVIFWPVLSLWLLAPVALLTRRHSRFEWICLVLAITHALSLVLVFPHNYYYRLMMPATLPLVIWDTMALTNVFEGLPDPSWAGQQAKRVLGGLG